MKIISIHTYLQKLPLTKPYTIAYKTIDETEIIFLEIELENGIVGFGASNPFPEVVGETPEITYQNLQSDVVRELIGQDIRNFHELIVQMNNQFLNLPGTQAAIDIALHDAFGQFSKKSILDIYGQKVKPLPTSITIGIKDTHAMLEEAQEYYARGFRILKVKTGADVTEDIERIQKLRESFGNKITIRVDANQGYDLAQIKTFIHQTAKLKIELIEQPLPVAKDDQLNLLNEDDRKYLVADESLLNSESTVKLAQDPKPYGVFNIKLMKCGGIIESRRIAKIAQNANISLFWGCNDESIVSISAALQAAYSCENTKFLDLDGSFDIVEKIFEGGFSINEGFMYPNGLPGLGIRKRK